MYNVLVVDDELLPRKFLNSLIPALDSRFRVVGEASDGNEALEIIRKQQLDLLITDIRMPEKDGLELCEEVHREFPKIKICILSGHEEFQYVQQAMLYRTEEYILKPINKEAIQEMLNRVAQRLDKQKAEESTLRGLYSLSDEAKRQVAMRFLQALITKSHAEISTLYPLVHRMKIPLFEGEGVMLLLSLDEHLLFQRMIPPKDHTVFHYILNQVASELASRFDMTWSLFDQSNHTCILLSGTDPNRVLQNVHTLFEQINSAMQSTTNLSVSGGIGCWIEDIFQVDESYMTALRANHLRFNQGQPGVLNEYFYQESVAAEPDPIDYVAESLRNAVMIPHAPEWAAKKLVNVLNNEGTVKSMGAYNLGAYILNKWTSGRQDNTYQNLDLAWGTLSILGGLGTQDATPSIIESVYSNVFSTLLDASDPVEEERNLEGNPSFIDKVLDYINLHYCEPISLAMIADHFQITPQYLSQLIHKQIGISYIKYLTKIRMDQALKLLTESAGIKVYEVAEQVGFDNVKHFMYVFKKHYGKTPGEYKKV